jgi:nifR3 family TIM-barrel protein
MLKIGNLELKSKFILAPMAGVSDLPFRMLNREFGCELAFTEMINCSSLSHKSKKTHKMLVSDKADRPLGVQLLGRKEGLIIRAIDALNRYDFDLLDFNAACPVKKVVNRSEGAGLLKEPKKLNSLLKLLVRHSPVPVTLKIRAGWDEKTINARDNALLAEDAGVSAVFIHGRTKQQGYSGNVDYQVIRQVKKALKIPVIASGDILSASLAKKMFDDTGCDAVAVARGALGNPWIFKESQCFLESGKILKRPSESAIIKVILKHLGACVDIHGERIGVVIFRKFFSWYTRGFSGIRQLRERSSRLKTHREMIAVIKACQK